MFTIKRIELIEIGLPLVHFFETSFGRTHERKIILVRVEDADGAQGWGEITCNEAPGYSEEWTGSAWLTTEKILAPMVIGKPVADASRVFHLMKRARGHRMSKAAIETACWDLEAKKLGAPLWRHLGGVRNEIPCGVSIGIQDSPEQLFDKIQTELDAGYQRIKLKIKPGWDFKIIKKVREKFGPILLMGDANSAYTLDDINLFKWMDEFDLMMFEQPFPGSMLRELAERIKALVDSSSEITYIPYTKAYASGFEDMERRVPHNLNVSFNFVEGESLIMAIKDVAVSSGYSCEYFTSLTKF